MRQLPPPDRQLPLPAVKRLAPVPLLKGLVALGDIAVRAGCHQVAALRRTTPGQRDHMVQGRLVPQAAIAVGATPSPGFEDPAAQPLPALFLGDQKDAINAVMRNAHEPHPVVSP